MVQYKAKAIFKGFILFIPKLLQKLVFGQFQSFRNSAIVSYPILTVLGHLRSSNFGANDTAEMPTFEVVWVYPKHFKNWYLGNSKAFAIRRS
jgi:hypothetical protein